MRKLWLGLFLLLGAAPAHAQNAGWPPPAGAEAMLCVYNLVAPTLTTGQVGFANCDANGKLLVAATLTPSGTQDVNLKQVGGATTQTGAGTASGAQRVELPTDGTGKVGLNAGSALIGAVSIDGAQVVQATSAALAANQVVKASSGQLYGFNVSGDATLSAAAWWVMVYNATSAPGDGAVTPAKCYALPSGTTSYSAAFPSPILLGTGITIGVSTTGCFTKTASTHAFISADYK